MTFLRICILTGAMAVFCGCKSPQLGPYTAPRVVGRVMAANSKLPLEGVTVRRGPFLPNRTELKGGELLMEARPARSSSDGVFEFPSERALTIFRPSGWDTVRLRFEAPGFQRLETKHSAIGRSTNAPGDEPLVDVGTIELRPKG
jgi:hypothetical protein